MLTVVILSDDDDETFYPDLIKDLLEDVKRILFIKLFSLVFVASHCYDTSVVTQIKLLYRSRIM